MSVEKLLGQLETAQQRAAQLEQQRKELIDTQAQANAELDSVVEEEKATAALARARVSGNRLVIVERDLSQARQAVQDLDLQILRAQIAEIEQQMQLGRSAMNDHLVRALDVAETYHELSKQRAALLERAKDNRYQMLDQLGNSVGSGCRKGLVALGWQNAVTADGKQVMIPPKEAVTA